MTRALVIGHGSAGQRHARLLADLGAEVGIVSRRTAANTFLTIDQALKQFTADYVVVANETSAHHATLRSLAEHGFTGRVLVEKPLWSSRDAALPGTHPNVHVGYNLRFHPALRAVRRLVTGKRVVSAEIVCGSYLPDWRTGRDYRKTSSALKASAGGVLHDLSHELDYACWLFGNWRRLTALGGHLSPLAIETDDVALILAETAGCPALSISLNYIERAARRGLIINTQDDTIVADLEAGTVRTAAGTVDVPAFALDDTYRAQHRAILSGNAADVCTYAQGLAVVGMMQDVEKAIAQRAWVTNAGGDAT